jgi:hypothetical protein
MSGPCWLVIASGAAWCESAEPANRDGQIRNLAIMATMHQLRPGKEPC